MVGDPEPMPFGNSVLEGFECLILEFHDLSAIQTDQVIVMAPFRSGLISGLSVSKFSLGCQAETGEELQGTINGDVADFGICFSDLSIDFRKVLMSGRVEKDREDLFPLFGCLQSFFGNACLKETALQWTSQF